MLVYRSVGVSKNRGNDPTRPGKGSGKILPLLGSLGTLCLPGKVLASGLFNGCLGISDVGPWAIHVALLQASLSAGELCILQALPEVVHVELVKHQWADHDSTDPCHQLHRDAMKSNESPHIDSKAQILGPQRRWPLPQRSWEVLFLASHVLLDLQMPGCVKNGQTWKALQTGALSVGDKEALQFWRGQLPVAPLAPSKWPDRSSWLWPLPGGKPSGALTAIFLLLDVMVYNGKPC